MNNAGFAEMVRKRSGVSSTKEIARKAVEDDWKRNKKRKRKGGGGSSSDSDFDDEPIRSKRDKKSNQNEEDEDDIFELSAEYRDRAKERRDGKTNEKDNANEDNAETHLPTKGLDLSLVRKRRKEIKDTDESEDSHRNNDASVDFKSLPTMEDAIGCLRKFSNGDDSNMTFKSNSTITEYTSKLLEQIIKNQRKSVTMGVAGKNIQQSRLALAIDGSPSNLKRSWEKPREIKHSSTINGLNPLHADIIETIKQVFPKQKYQQENQLAQGVAGSKPTDNANPSQEPTKTVESEEEEDDIFGGLDDYIPLEKK